MSHFTETHPPMLSMAFSAALIALLVSYCVDAEPFTAQAAQVPVTDSVTTAAMPFELPTLAPSAIVLSGDPGFRVDNGILKLYFGPSKTELPNSAIDALEEIVEAIHQGKRVQILGFHDTTGNPKQNILLSQKRSEAVKKRLIALGAPAKAIEIKKPAIATIAQDVYVSCEPQGRLSKKPVSASAIQTVYDGCEHPDSPTKKPVVASNQDQDHAQARRVEVMVLRQDSSTSNKHPNG